MTGEKGVITILKIKERRTARRIFARGPAKDIKAESFLGSFKLKGSTGTGFAQPNTKGEPIKMRNRGINTVPYKSAWAIGFRVILPFKRAVGSPSLSAVQAWAAS